MTRKDLGPCAGLLGLLLFIFPSALFRGEVFYERDLHLDVYPRTDHWVRAFAEGSWPLWDNWIGFGQPLLADPSAQILYPFTWLNLFLLPWRYYTVFVVFHVALAGLGLYFLARSFELSRGASFAAGALWMASGPLLSLANVHHLAAAALLPWVLLAARSLFGRPTASAALRLGVVECLQVLAGSPDVSAMTNLVIAAWALLRLEWRRPARSGNWRLLAALGGAASIALGLSAMLWLPALELASRSSRSDLSAEVQSGWSVPLPGLLRAVFPLLVNDDPLSDGRRLALFDADVPFLASIYLGMGALALAALSFLGSRSRTRVWIALLGVGAVLVSLGPHAFFYGLALEALPFLRWLRYPSKAMLVAAFVTALLAGFGLDAASRRGGIARLPAVLLAVLGGGAAALLAAAPETGAVWVLGQVPTAPLAPVLLPLAGKLALGAVAAAAVALGPRLAFRPVLVALALGDLVLAHHSLHATVPVGFLRMEPPAASALRPEGRARVYVFDYHSMRGKSERYLKRAMPYAIGRLPPDWVPRRAQVFAQRLYLVPPSGAWWGLEGSFDQDVRGLFPTSLRNLVLLLRASEGTPEYSRLLRLGAVSSVLALHTEGLEELVPASSLTSFFPEQIRVFRVPGALPRSYAVGGARVASGPDAFAKLVDPGFDATREVIVPEGPPLEAGAGFRGASRIVDYRPDRVRLEAELTAAGHVVLVDAWDPGWRAIVDGTPAPVVRANVAFRAVRVGAGRHGVQLVYRPRAVLVGLGVTALTALLLGLGLALGARRERPSQAQQAS